MELNIRLKLLDRIYRLYGDVVASYDLACRKGCTDCCTCNVTLTTLEGYRIAEGLTAGRRSNLLEMVKKAPGRRPFRPQITTNGIAQLCAAGREIPAEEIDPDWGVCELLQEKL